LSVPAESEAPSGTPEIVTDSVSEPSVSCSSAPMLSAIDASSVPDAFATVSVGADASRSGARSIAAETSPAALPPAASVDVATSRNASAPATSIVSVARTSIVVDSTPPAPIADGPNATVPPVPSGPGVHVPPPASSTVSPSGTSTVAPCVCDPSVSRNCANSVTVPVSPLVKFVSLPSVLRTSSDSAVGASATGVTLTARSAPRVSVAPPSSSVDVASTCNDSTPVASAGGM
jgi:hypothetical protein